MESESDSDGSHISATPPCSPSTNSVSSPLKFRYAVVANLIRAKTSASVPTTSRTLVNLKIPKKKRIPLPEPEKPQSLPRHEKPQPEPVDSTPLLSNLPFDIKNLPNSEKYKSARDGFLHGGISRFASFSKNTDKVIKFELETAMQCEGSSKSAGSGEASKDNVVYTDSSVKKARKNVNLIGRKIPDIQTVKKIRNVGGGNFVKLNINGYGRKRFMFKNRRNSFASSNKRRKYSRSHKLKSEGGLKGDEEEGLVLDVEKGKRRGQVKFDSKRLEEAVENVRVDASDENLLKLLSLVHGYDSFRKGQLEAIKMVLSMKSTMLVLPTGAGKSLCYQLPALLLPGITLVVSPLVALMIDQLKHLPPAIPGGLLCSNQTAEEASETLCSLQQGEIKVLFVSPERLLNAEFLSLFSGSLQLSLVVIDEAHCVSEWSHNFRPSYMRLRASSFHGRLNAGCILSMTATATNKTLFDVMDALEIPRSNLIQSAEWRDNLQLSVSYSENRLKDLMNLLKAPPFSEIGSIIIYCKFQSETDIISKHLCDSNISAKSYHSGLSAKDRRHTQDLFCSNKIRVVVATVAFGMGLDKSDVGAVIHYSLPGSLEEYVQEFGRAGRDGRPSFCHLLFDNAAYFKLRSLKQSDGVDEYAVNKLLAQIFVSDGPPRNRTFSIIKESASIALDMKEEVILTILTRLELGEKYIYLHPEMNVTCCLNFHKTSPSILAGKDVVVAEILRKSEMKGGKYVFHIPTVANGVELQAHELSNHLHSLRMEGEITYELKDQAFCYSVSKVPNDICSLAATLTQWLDEVETCKVRKLDAMFSAATSAAKLCKSQQSSYLQRNILEYFSENGSNVEGAPPLLEQDSPFLRADIKVFVNSNGHSKLSPRAVARILHGLGSPAFPSSTWSRTHFWGRYVQTDFKAVIEAAKAELISQVGINKPCAMN